MRSVVLKFLLEQDIDIEMDHILVAVSGGMDSMLLHDLLSSHLPERAHIAHVNYQMRGEDSDLDEDLVRQRASAQMCNFHLRRWSDWDETDRAGNFQERARLTRYAWMKALCDRHDYAGIYVAHHLDDQLETFLIALSRGAGIRGLRAMSPVRDSIYRPLLQISREQIASAVKERHISYRDDKSNDSSDYLRNRVRHDLTPVIKSVFPDILRQLEYSLGSLQSHEKVWKEISPGKVEFPYRPETEIQYINLFYTLQSLGISRADWRDVRAHLESGQATSRYILGNGSVISISRGVAYLSGHLDEGKPPVSLELLCGVHDTVHGRLAVSTLQRRKEISSDELLLPEEYLGTQVCIRAVMEGDFMKPFGMRGTKKISDYMVDSKFTPTQKSHQLVLVDSQDRILWLIDHRASELTRIRDDSACLLLQWSRAE